MVIFGIVNRDAYNQLILLIKRLRADKNSFWVLVDLERGSVLESPSMTAYSGSIFLICRLFLDFNEVKCKIAWHCPHQLHGITRTDCMALPAPVAWHYPHQLHGIARTSCMALPALIGMTDSP